jgi:LacI family transcriptional regulator
VYPAVTSAPASRGGPRVARARPATLKAIADQLGLHVSTVSRVLNGPPEGSERAASGATAERIRRLADELGYRRNPHAKSLRTARSDLVGVLVPQLADLVLALVYEGIEEAAAERGLSTFVMNTRDDEPTQRARTELAIGRRVDGLIFADGREDTELLAEVAAREVPFVLVNRPAGDFPVVACDNRAGGRMVAEHLLERGHQRVAVVAGPAYARTARERTAGFVERYREAGFPVPEELVVHSRFDTGGGREATARIMQAAGAEPPTALFAVNDFAAIGAAGCAREHGLLIGRDIAVAGFNDTPLAAELPVPLTSVRVPVHEMGRRALGLLADLIGGRSVGSVHLPPELVVRASTTGGA